MEKERAKKIGQSIRQKRKARGITMKELGSMIGCSEQAISQYERGERRLNVVSLIMIANALQCAHSDLVSEEDLNYLRGKTEIISNYPQTEDGAYPPDSRTEEQKQAEAHAFWKASGSIIKRDHQQHSLAPKEISPEQQQRYADVARRAAPGIQPHAQLPDSGADNLARLHAICAGLTDEGRRRLLEYAEELTQIPRYRRSPDGKGE